jgi:hypothetical protein
VDSKSAAQFGGEVATQVEAREVDGLGVDDAAGGDDFLGQHLFRGQGQRFGGEGGVVPAVGQHPGVGRDQAWRNPGIAMAAGSDAGEQHAGRQALSGFPAVEGVGVVRHEVGEFGIGLVEVEMHGRREAAQDGGHRRLCDAVEDEALA